mmetsp:Transcript_1423/g.4190  ORF Transcript_1423/g.4190 Transcript_1423/m.4190 type:complete len:239 (+) Transcript_1423:1531-2247(+)
MISPGWRLSLTMAVHTEVGFFNPFVAYAPLAEAQLKGRELCAVVRREVAQDDVAARSVLVNQFILSAPFCSCFVQGLLCFLRGLPLCRPCLGTHFVHRLLRFRFLGSLLLLLLLLLLLGGLLPGGRHPRFVGQLGRRLQRAAALQGVPERGHDELPRLVLIGSAFGLRDAFVIQRVRSEILLDHHNPISLRAGGIGHHFAYRALQDENLVDGHHPPFPFIRPRVVLQVARFSRRAENV